MNEPGCLKGVTTARIVAEVNGRGVNVAVIQIIVPEGPLHLKRLDNIGVRALQSIVRREETFVDCGTPYQFVTAH